MFEQIAFQSLLFFLFVTADPFLGLIGRLYDDQDEVMGEDGHELPTTLGEAVADAIDDAIVEELEDRYF